MATHTLNCNVITFVVLNLVHAYLCPQADNHPPASGTCTCHSPGTKEMISNKRILQIPLIVIKNENYFISLLPHICKEKRVIILILSYVVKVRQYKADETVSPWRDLHMDKVNIPGIPLYNIFKENLINENVIVC